MIPDSLKPNQQAFCRNYILNKQTKWCWQHSYAQAYWKDPIVDNATCRTNASRLLAKDDIKKYCRALLDEYIFNDMEIDLELSKIIQQDHNLLSKLWWIKEYNRLRKRLTYNNTDTGV